MNDIQILNMNDFLKKTAIRDELKLKQHNSLVDVGNC